MTDGFERGQHSPGWPASRTAHEVLQWEGVNWPAVQKSSSQ